MTDSTIADPRVWQPAEWTPHDACWMAFPHNVFEWGEPLAAAQAEVVALCRAIADLDPATGQPRGERIELLVPNLAILEQARHALAGLPVTFHLMPYDDIWLRDCGPIFVQTAEESMAAAVFQFNVWGQKFNLPQDERLALQIAKLTGLPILEHPWVLEGGAIETDGAGTCLTTRQCLLNPNRNPHLTQTELEDRLKQALGYQTVLWLEEGLRNDHTDGHIDTIARFVAPGVVVCMVAHTRTDPNAAVLDRIAQTLATLVDAQGRTLQVVTLPSPGLVPDAAGQPLAASYVNFYIGNRTVVVPTYDTDFDEAAIAAIAACFPGRRTVGLSARALITAGGAFHCITQQQPSNCVRI